MRLQDRNDMRKTSQLKDNEDAYEEKRGILQSRRFGEERRENKTHNYSGPSRRMTLDRRNRSVDRRKQS